MAKNTDMDLVKALAKTLLHLEIQPTKFSPVIVSHPFTDTGIIGLPDKNKKTKMIDLLRDSEGRDDWRVYMTNRIEKSETVSEILAFVTKPYKLTFISFAEQYLSKDDLSDAIRCSWSSIEIISNDIDVSPSRIRTLLKKCNPLLLMDATEKKEYASLPDVITVYRGVNGLKSQKQIKSFSWSLDKDIAEWFSSRFGGDSHVYQAEIEKAHVFAYFKGRGEEEIVVDPKFLLNITEITK